MENKYYTPTIEEFHVGFEFEQKIGISVLTKDEVWVKSIFSIVPNSDELISMLREGIIRVKYLDREDIESLGFIISKNFIYTGYNIIFEQNKRQLLFCPETKRLCISNITTTNNEGVFNLNIIFEGTIKNKSELQKLLVQLGIK